MDQTTTTTTTHCTRTDLANGVYELNVVEPTRQAVEELFAHWAAICEETRGKDNTVVKILLVTTNKPMPFVSTASELKKWSAKYGKMPSRTAILYEGAFATMADLMSRSMGFSPFPFRIFKQNKRDEAIAWLMDTE
jgi:hypothetical protein